MQLSIDFSAARELGEQAAAACLAKARRADPEFSEKAAAAILAHLATHGPTSGEDLTAMCMASGIIPINGPKAFGGVFLSLSKRHLIVCLRSDLPRRFGHGTSGGKLWALINA